MKILCAPLKYKFSQHNADLDVVLFGGRGSNKKRGCVGETLRNKIVKAKLAPAPRAWDLLALSLAVVSADLGVRRADSPDGWTREIDLVVAVQDKKFWDTQVDLVQDMLRFLSTDIWNVEFVEADIMCPTPEKPKRPKKTAVILLSGGLDSLVGALDLNADGEKLLAVSQVADGDKRRQQKYAGLVGAADFHLQLNHNAVIPNPDAPLSQRARSLVFLAYGVLGATTLDSYDGKKKVPLYVCENGMIAINPPMTDMRIGSLSTRTAHPAYLGMLQKLLDAAGLKVAISNPYAFMTKGEMLRQCRDQKVLRKHASDSTSCGRFKRNAYKHCGRCVPCLIRRASFDRWGRLDKTKYRYKPLGKNDKDHARFDDVRSAAMAVAYYRKNGIDKWLGATLSAVPDKFLTDYAEMAERGLQEIGKLLKRYKVK